MSASFLGLYRPPYGALLGPLRGLLGSSSALSYASEGKKREVTKMKDFTTFLLNLGGAGGPERGEVGVMLGFS